jgi:energy-coupling factor transporter ATP-binding protein EcfA2
MRIPSFVIREQRSITLAQCEDVPSLMVVAGPNGSGKSTLLNALRQHPGPGRILYLGPHRTSRRQQVQFRHLHQQPISLQELMSRSDVPGYEGISMITGSRDPWSFDDSVNYLKHGLCQIEVERQAALTARFDRHGEIPKGSMPDVWQPLRDLTRNLLPHLRFSGIDATDRNQVRCLWEVHRKGLIVDLDDLSSGEKSIIQIFYPLVEHRVKALLQTTQPGDAQPGPVEVCVLIDEPELHLHPNLQAKVVDYLRVLTSDEHTQVMVATHSPNIVEYATFDELFLLRPVEHVAPGENQLVQVATDEERLRFLRDVFGTTANLTAFQSIVIVEGGDREERARRATDRKLYRALHPCFDRVTIIPGGGKSECLKLREMLKEALHAFTEKLDVVALLDRDLASEGPLEAGTYLLPVSMIENLFLDPETIWDAIQSVFEKTTFTSAKDVARALDIILAEVAETEVERRIGPTLGCHVFRPKAPFDDMASQFDRFVATVRDAISTESLLISREQASGTVANLARSKQRREFFHGKIVLELFYKRHLHQTGLSKEIFRFYLARAARGRKSVKQFFDTFFADLFPEEPVSSSMAGPADEV